MLHECDREDSTVEVESNSKDLAIQVNHKKKRIAVVSDCSISMELQEAEDNEKDGTKPGCGSTTAVIDKVSGK